MKIAVLGCGAIGGLFLGYLTQTGQDVIGIVRDYQKGPLSGEGLIIEGARSSQTKVRVDTELREAVDLAIFTTKIQNLEEIINANHVFLKEATLLSTQNGIRADYILSDYFPKDKIISGIVMFGATFYPPNKVVHNFGDELIVGNIFSENVALKDEVKTILGTVFKVSELDNIKGAKYLKLLINLNNCIPALMGKSMQEVFADIDMARLAVELSRQAYQVISKSGIELVSLPGYPKERLESLVSMPPEEAAQVFSKIMTGLSKKPLFGSILQSIKRQKKSEIDYINGEIVKLALSSNADASLNAAVVELVHRVENGEGFFSKEKLLSYIKGAVSHEKQ